MVTLCNIQHTSGNQPLKEPALGSADKYFTLLPLVCPIKLVFHLQFFHTKRLFAEFSLVSDFFLSKKGRIQSFLLFSTEKRRSIWKNLQVQNQLWDQVCPQEICRFYPNIHHIPYLTLKLWNDPERTIKCKWSKVN